MIGNTELLVVASVFLLLFGPDKLLELSRQIGKTVKHVRDFLDDEDLAG